MARAAAVALALSPLSGITGACDGGPTTFPGVFLELPGADWALGSTAEVTFHVAASDPAQFELVSSDPDVLTVGARIGPSPMPGLPGTVVEVHARGEGLAELTLLNRDRDVLDRATVGVSSVDHLEVFFVDSRVAGVDPLGLPLEDEVAVVSHAQAVLRVVLAHGSTWLVGEPAAIELAGGEVCTGGFDGVATGVRVPILAPGDHPMLVKAGELERRLVVRAVALSEVQALDVEALPPALGSLGVVALDADGRRVHGVRSVSWSSAGVELGRGDVLRHSGEASTAPRELELTLWPVEPEGPALLMRRVRVDAPRLTGALQSSPAYTACD